MPQRQEYKKYERDLKNIMKRSNRHPPSWMEEILEIKENRGETILEEIMPKNFPEPKIKRFKFTNIRNYVFPLFAIRRIIVKLQNTKAQEKNLKSNQREINNNTHKKPN